MSDNRGAGTKAPPGAIEVVSGAGLETGAAAFPRGGVDPLVVLEQRNRLIERLLAYAVGATRGEQWTDMDGKPWPSGPAAEVMARRCGVSITNTRGQRYEDEDDAGRYYWWTYTCTASLPSGFDSIEAVGTCSSRDTFLGTETRQGRKLSDIDQGNIMKAAYTNMLVNAVTRLLGVRGLTWESLGKLGVERGAAAKVEHRSGARGGGREGSADEELLRFGPGSGKRLADLAPEQLSWYVKVFERDLADPEKAKFRARTEKMLAAAKAIQSSRASAPAASGGPEPIWTVLERAATKVGVGLDDLKRMAKEAGAASPVRITQAQADAVMAKLPMEEEAEPGSDG